MRISKQYINVIKEITIETFGIDTKVYLFGSRVDDNKKGGDIDLYIDKNFSKDFELMYNKKIEFLTKLDLSLGEQKIDVVISKDKNRSIEKEAIKTGIEL